MNTYTRMDMPPDTTRDMTSIEDAAYCIAKAFGKARDSSKALKAVAQFVRSHSWLPDPRGSILPDQTEKDHRRRLIETQADKLEELATSALEGYAQRDQFEAILSKLHAVRFYPENSLISDVAHAMV